MCKFERRSIVDAQGDVSDFLLVFPSRNYNAAEATGIENQGQISHCLTLSKICVRNMTKCMSEMRSTEEQISYILLTGRLSAVGEITV